MSLHSCGWLMPWALMSIKCLYKSFTRPNSELYRRTAAVLEKVRRLVCRIEALKQRALECKKLDLLSSLLGCELLVLAL